MSQSDLRLIGAASPQSSPQGSHAPSAPNVPLKLGEVVELLWQARRGQYAWLDDMAEEPILVTADLAEILAHFRQIAVNKSA